MSDDQHATQPASKKHDMIRRRTIVKGAAWSVPVIAAAAAAPMAAASCGTSSGTFTTPSAGEFAVTIPACATSVTFVVAGGDGQRISATDVGRGAVISGTLALTSGTSHVITLIAGESPNGGAIPRVGGIGFGNGGTGYGAVGGGGGGSAILLDGVPSVVAGGGGGGGNPNVTAGNPGDSVIRLLAPESGVNAGKGTADDPAGTSTGYGNKSTYNGALVLAVGGGEGATGSTGGAAAAPVVYGAGAAGTEYPGTAGGNNGTGNHGGGNGGDDGLASLPSGAGAGGGGGGWAGGGGGRAVSKTAGGNPTGVLYLGTQGGAGSSFVGGTGVTVASDGPRTDARGNGSIVISWS
ncbi:hypothetical protein [Microbacterium sp. MMO-10]|uniref:hypothetical protein n=1 Tax=Microbacterium sp. MMO-10 TaxID=3081272 RepID=UPI003017C033